MGIVVAKDLFDYALMKPCRHQERPDRLLIVSGYASHSMAADHILKLKAEKRCLDIDLVYGMAGVEGVKALDHIGFISLHKQSEFKYDGRFDCHYVKKPCSVHSKVYVWCRGKNPLLAFIGSANYTNNGFRRKSRVETLAECDPVTAYEFFQKIKKKAVSCQVAKVKKDFKKGFVARKNLVVDKKSDSVIQIEHECKEFLGCEKIVIPLRNGRGNFGAGSGLNWGLDKKGKPRLQNKRKPNGGRRDPNEAYIRVPKAFDCGFFPPYVRVPRGARAKDRQIRFSVLTDDHKIFSCIRASGGYGKEIETPQDNTELGRWFRKRLGLAEGAMITKAVMKAYGRDDVTFYKLDDDQFFMDFSRPKRG